ncbi:Inhibitor of growth protein 3 [Lachancea thermotolerans]|uniref:KLTH0F17578p n=1 Tax=Lachancea thermotolerans (strain ATCC 56472 / CBS 6340 / NRRL Y-8284) TaxID=559295 RepID=C5DJM2_LACTC|nr:KLTH0F17578p [Lachancea thermotolerans CBS 6340]CAR24511.1 KLTH0F17578p [Lachancea thermotolerans CBS 6340]
MDTDVRYTFLDTLDHLPSELIRGLWTLQGLELREDQQRNFVDQEAVKEAQHLERLLRQHREWLEFQKQEMREMAAVRARYEAYEGTVESRGKPSRALRENATAAAAAAEPKPPTPLKIKINLRPSQPEEPRYCVCRDVSYGAMIACDNKRCPTEWFHYGCVGLLHAPKPNKKWYCCDKCRRQATKKK